MRLHCLLKQQPWHISNSNKAKVPGESLNPLGEQNAARCPASFLEHVFSNTCRC